MIVPVAASVGLAALNVAHVRGVRKRTRPRRPGLRGLGCATGWMDQNPNENCTPYCNTYECDQAKATECNRKNALRQIAVQEIQEAYEDCFPDNATWTVDTNSGAWSVSQAPSHPSREQSCPNPNNPACCGSSLCNPAGAAAPVYIGTGDTLQNTSPAAGATPYVASSPVAGASSAAMAFSLTWSRAGAVVYPGDTWTATVSGAPAFAAVVAVGGKQGAGGNNNLGSTDANGNFRATGTVGANDVGQWSETWTVGGVTVGNVSFSVQLPAAQSNSPGAQTVGGGTGQSNAAASSSTAGGSAQTVAAATSWLSDATLIGGVPNWLMVGAAALLVGVFAFKR
jgi:hypothetical protein